LIVGLALTARLDALPETALIILLDRMISDRALPLGHYFLKRSASPINMYRLPKLRSLTRRATGAFVEGCARLAELHPFAWKVAWEAVHRLPFLLPHDKSYNAFRHFVAQRANGLFLDVGANDGISILSFRKFNSTYRILALEPNPLLEPALRRIKSNDPYLDYRMVGAGAAPARLQFFVPIYRGILLHTLPQARANRSSFQSPEVSARRLQRRSR